MAEENRYNIVRTEDGSDTVFSGSPGISFHSIHGAIQESNHVFLNAALKFFIENHAVPEQIRIFEMGFGTGLNALLAARVAIRTKTKLIYHAIDLHPLPGEILSQLNYADLLQEPALYTSIIRLPWDQEIDIDPYFTLMKTVGDFGRYTFHDNYHLIFYDAFAPEDQPGLWTSEVFQKIFDAMLPGGILTTYCAKSVVRKKLISIGFHVEKLPGPPGKREIIRAIKP
jgi:tRNA U34 5-methylaminomethyl-2-thiouridine-forming methyltransferase MnmC